ncbi:hypothetical protein DHW03_01805 [Pedobacter yonginense]|uniref:HD/PDEase domain-containing protein n=1 Tax=Pedobacter yonginense TaxID=651869 RepID=A0A317EP17_9SPHI|nr:HD domain-containing protein [Pedobacter yonginense]PWS28610.1 hypothetical protein DHW03_01805 [Pedobacter yonginense]
MDQSVGALLNQVEHFVADVFKNRLSENMFFHNLEHTLLVVEGVQIIAEAVGLSNQEKVLVILAAFLHDVGYTEKYLGHEEMSANMATAFLIKQGLAPEATKVVKSCILATSYPQYPNTLLERVICDADFYHFSLQNYQEYAHRLKKEWKLNLGLDYSQAAWDQLNLNMLQQHEYFTNYGKTILQEKKADNIAILLKRTRKV